MELHVFLISWISAILAMTGFSALVSKILGYELREHVMLTQLVFTVNTPTPTKKPKIWVGWAIHFAFGLLFMGFYELAWTYSEMERTVLWSIVLGVGMGIVGILGWMVIFWMHPYPPKIRFAVYYVQLLFAHIVFSMTAFFGYTLL